LTEDLIGQQVAIEYIALDKVFTWARGQFDHLFLLRNRQARQANHKLIWPWLAAAAQTQRHPRRGG
jgi:hypothetical protein